VVLLDVMMPGKRPRAAACAASRHARSVQRIMLSGREQAAIKSAIERTRLVSEVSELRR